MKTWGAASLAMHYAWTLLFSLVIPLLVGIWLDKRLNTIPLFILIGAALGILAATVGVARMAMKELSRSVAGVPDEGAGADLEEEPD